MIKTNIGGVLKKYRKSCKITQKQMSEMINVSQNHLSAIERNVYKANMMILLFYIEICKIPITEFFEKEV